MDKYNLLECTLRDGGYINKWKFNDDVIREMIREMIESNFDFIEVGYLNRNSEGNNTTQFKNIKQIESFIPADRGNSIILAMADIDQFFPEDLTQYDGKSIDGIRVVFYKERIDEALIMCEAVQKAGYKLFVQPMVTIDYSLDEYAKLMTKVNKMHPYAVCIVDSFGYMMKSDFRTYYRILDNALDQDVIIGFHSHNNMNLAFITAQDILEYMTQRRLVIDCSLYGMGRGAGNLNTELIANYYNSLLGNKYDCKKIINMISNYIMPIRKERTWGYSPFLFLTGLYHYHPNFACYLLDEYPDISVVEFEEYLNTIPADMKTKCKKPYVIEKWKEYKKLQ